MLRKHFEAVFEKDLQLISISCSCSRNISLNAFVSPWNRQSLVSVPMVAFPSIFTTEESGLLARGGRLLHLRHRDARRLVGLF